MRLRGSVLAAAVILILASSSRSQVGGDLRLDFGNDTDYEWTAPWDFVGPQRLDIAGYVNRYVRGGCWCVGCVYDAASGNCTVPVVFTSKYAGNLTVDDIALGFEKVKVLGEVGYGRPFRKSEGSCWDIRFPDGYHMMPIPANHPCTSAEYRYPDSGVITTDDAIDDAMYRLLNGTLDNETAAAGGPDGVLNIGYNGNLSFGGEGKIGVQTLWGPVKMRLIVWA